MALLLVFLLLVGFSFGGVGSSSSGNGSARVTPYRSAKLHGYTGDRCNVPLRGKRGSKKPLPTHLCAARSGVSP